MGNEILTFQFGEPETEDKKSNSDEKEELKQQQESKSKEAVSKVSKICNQSQVRLEKLCCTGKLSPSFILLPSQ